MLTFWPSEDTPPIPDSPSNPFFNHNAPANPSGDDFLHRPHTPASPDDAELFPDPSPSSSTGSVLRTPAPRPRGTPRVGRHSTATRRHQSATSHTGSARATRKPSRVKKGARDVWPFFEDSKTDNVRFCVFCKCALSAMFFNASIDYFYYADITMPSILPMKSFLLPSALAQARFVPISLNTILSSGLKAAISSRSRSLRKLRKGPWPIIVLPKVKKAPLHRRVTDHQIFASIRMRHLLMQSQSSSLPMTRYVFYHLVMTH